MQIRGAETSRWRLLLLLQHAANFDADQRDQSALPVAARWRVRQPPGNFWIKRNWLKFNSHEYSGVGRESTIAGRRPAGSAGRLPAPPPLAHSAKPLHSRGHRQLAALEDVANVSLGQSGP